MKDGCTAVVAAVVAVMLVVTLWVIVTLLECSIHPYDVLECEPEMVSGFYVDMGAVLLPGGWMPPHMLGLLVRGC